MRWLGRTGSVGLLLLCLLALPAAAGVRVDFDSKTLNELLAAVTMQEVMVPITEERSLKVVFEELKLTGLAPNAGGDEQDYLLTELRVRVPQFGLELALEPRLSLGVTDVDAARSLELRFEKVELPLPLGSIDIARFLPPIRYPADTVYLLAGAQGNVQVRSRLARVRMGREVLQFEFDVDVQPSP